MTHGQTTDWKKMNALVPGQFPEFMRSMAPQFVEFVRAYYEWMDQTGGPNHALANLRNYRSIDRTLDEYLDFFHNEYLERIPKNLATDRRNLVKHITQFYRTAGSKKSVRFLFRILFDEDIDFYLPGQDMLRLSDGKWQIDRSLKVQLISPGFDLSQVVFGEIVGTQSGARTRVESATSTLVGQVQVIELFVSRIIGDFLPGEQLRFNGDPFATIDSHGLYTYPGRYIGTDGFLSSDKKLQDNLYYQEFSYVIKAGRVLSTYGHLLKGLTHPAGTLMFGQIQLVQEFNLTIPQLDTALTLSTVTSSIVDLAPIVNTGIYASDSASVEGLIVIEIDVDDTNLLTSTTARVSLPGSPIDVYVIHSNIIGDLAGYSMSEFTGWPISSFTSGKGVIAPSGSILSLLAANQPITWVDTAHVVADSYNEVAAISSDYSFMVKFSPVGGIVNPAIVV